MTLDEAKTYISDLEKNGLFNKLVKIKFSENGNCPWSNLYNGKTFYGIIVGKYKYEDGYILVNHPYNIEKKQIDCGEANIFVSDVESITKVENDEAKQEWINAYNDWHYSIIEEKGYDCCEIDIEKIL